MGLARRLEVFQHLTVDAVEHHDTRVLVTVSGPEGERHRVTFFFADADVAADQTASMLRWREARTSLTYIRGDGDGVLLDDAEVFRQAFGETDPIY